MGVGADPLRWWSETHTVFHDVVALAPAAHDVPCFQNVMDVPVTVGLKRQAECSVLIAGVEGRLWNYDDAEGNF